MIKSSIVGIMVLIREDYNVDRFQGEAGEATWFKIGRQIAKALIE